MDLTVILICIALITKDAKLFFCCLSFGYPLEKSLFKSFAYFFQGSDMISFIYFPTTM